MEFAFRKEDMQVDDGYISKPELIEFPTANGETAYGFYYPPSNADFSTEGGAPPLLVKAHGGPTAQTSIVFNPALQFWTSRGFAVFLGERLNTLLSFCQVFASVHPLLRCFDVVFVVTNEVGCGLPRKYRLWQGISYEVEGELGNCGY